MATRMTKGYRVGRASLGALLLAVIAVIASPAMASTTQTNSFSVGLALSSSCTVSASNITFTATGLLTSALTSNGTVSVQCSNTTSYNVGLNAGTGSGATVANRLMTGPGAATVSYNLFQNAGLSTQWGTTIGSNTVAGTGNGTTQTITIYGQVPAQTTPAPGSYLDTVTVSVTY